MKFTDMNFDCLETVLEYLELIDLLNVADSTKRLNKAAELVYAQKHGNKIVRIRTPRFYQNRTFEIRDKEMFIDDLKTALQLLRCFGPVIYKISFAESFENLSEIDQKIGAYINKYCADYLEELQINQISSAGNDLLNYFDRPFPKVTIFQSMDLVATENVCLNRLFPKMRCLSNTHINNISFYNINTKHFPYLEELYICDFGHFLRNEMVINLLKLNPQLRMLSIDSYGILNTDLIRIAVDSLQNVESLKLLLNPMTILDNSDNAIRMKNVKSFDIDFGTRSFGGSSLPFTFKNLVKFNIAFPRAQSRNGFFIDQFLNFIERHSLITSLGIFGILNFGVVDWTRLAESLPLLLEIEISECYISADEAIETIAKFQMLNKFRFYLKGDYDSFREILNMNWDGTYETREQIVELYRKM